MNPKEKSRFDSLYQKHLSALKRHGKAPKTIDAYARGLSQVKVQVGAETLKRESYALDFHEVHKILSEAVTPLDGSDLNTHPEIGRPSPTAERVAEVLAEVLAPLYEDIGGQLLSVSIWEGPENRVDLMIDA